MKLLENMLWLSVYNPMYKAVQFINHITTQPTAGYVAICIHAFMLKIWSRKPWKSTILDDSTIF
jgi:hypothetical protein